MKIVLIGAGQRGMIYAKYAREKGHEITAVAETDASRRAIAGDLFGIPADRRFTGGEELLSQPKLGDAAIIATMDRDHFREAIPAMEKGYHLLLEKPISPVPEETLAIEEAAVRTGRHVTVCHVLRYSPFFRELKKAVTDGKIGRVITIQHNENIGNYHIAHSFVRGNWRRSDLASPLVMQKSCHDMDLLVWLADSRCESIASFGDLTYFRAENAPEGSAERCCDCALKDSCRFSAYRCDNNVCDHQVSILRFKNGVTATFNLSGFTNRMTRTIKIMGEDGEIRASEEENVIEITRFAANGMDRYESETIRPEVTLSGHSGGDSGIVEDFLDMLNGKADSSATDIHESVESHMMACAAEEARVTGSVIRIDDFRRAHERKLQG